jgi:hypothetical protein
MKSLYRLIDNPNNYRDITIGNLYLGEVSSCGTYLEFRDDVNDKNTIYLSRFEAVGDCVKTLQEELEVVTKTYEKKRDELLKRIENAKEDGKVKVGQKYVNIKSGDEYMVFQTDFLIYSLCGLVSGNRWGKPTPDIEDIFGGDRDKFKKI